MQGGKDDLFIYDRCGRLAYFIPFPLSIMGSEKDAVVPSAILSTYFQSPCGPSCETLPDLQEDTNNQTTLEPDFSTPLYPELFNNSSSEQTLFNETSAVNNSTDFPLFFDSLEEEDEDDYNITDHHHHNDLPFVMNETRADEGTNVTDVTVIVPFNRSNEMPMLVFSNETDGENVTFVTSTTTQVPPKKKSDRCAEADMSICRNWSKRKLLRAQTCCNDSPAVSNSDSCRHYGKKRCKKIRTVLKCCLKTSYTVAATPQPQSDDVLQTTPGDVEAVQTSTDDVKLVKTTSDDVKLVKTTSDDVNIVKTTSDDVNKVQTTTEDVTTLSDYVVCCKVVRGDRTCRVSLEGECDVNETIAVSQGVQTA